MTNLYLDGRKRTRRGYEYDTQFNKIVAASNENIVPRGRPLPTVGDMQQYIALVIRSRYWKNHHGDHWWVLVKDGRGRRNAGADCAGLHNGGYLLMPRWSRCELILLHEMAHLISHRKPHAPHGRLFAKTFLDLVRWKMGKEAHAALRAAFRKHRVKWHPHRQEARR